MLRRICKLLFYVIDTVHEIGHDYHVSTFRIIILFINPIICFYSHRFHHSIVIVCVCDALFRVLTRFEIVKCFMTVGFLWYFRFNCCWLLWNFSGGLKLQVPAQDMRNGNQTEYSGESSGSTSLGSQQDVEDDQMIALVLSEEYAKLDGAVARRLTNLEPVPVRIPPRIPTFQLFPWLKV